MIEFRFAHPITLLLLGVMAIVLVIRFVRMRGDQHMPALRYSDTRLMSGIPPSWRIRIRLLPDLLRIIAWGVLVIALARPQTGSAREILRGQGIDIVLVLDISGSMAALDFEPQNRLTAAKAVIGEFIGGRQYDRIGLVVFARNAYHQAPLTLDYPTLIDLLNQVRLAPEIVDANGQPLILDGSAIGLGIASAGTMLRDSPAPSRVIVLLTDGDNNASLDPITAAQAMQAFDIRIYTIGMGKTGQVPFPDRQNGVIFQESDLDEATLQQIADQTGGLYFRAENSAGLTQIYAEIDRLERSRVERQVFVPWQDQAWVWIGVAIGLLVIERVLRETLFQTIP